jgi:hypothetical protein
MNQWVGLQSMVKGPVKSGNICQIWGVPVDWLVKYPEFNPTTQYLNGDMVVGWQKYWLKFAASASGKGFKEELKYLKGSAYWEQTLQFRTCWQSGQTDITINNMAHHRWIFMFKEAGTGIYYVIGKPWVGAELAVTYSNSQGTITEFKASFKSIHRAPLYTGVNRAAVRIVDAGGNFIIDAEGNYLCTIGEMVAPTDPAGDFSGSDFTNSDFYVE